MKYLPYDPGPLPTKPPPKAGDLIELEITGYPPYKDESFSIRNPKHKHYSRFMKLRNAGIAAMDGRAWSYAPIRMDLTLYAPAFERKRTLLDYIAGVEDTLDGSSGFTFTYLPIVFEDDCQICSWSSRLIKSNKTKYALRVRIMKEPQQNTPVDPESRL
jgi:hypothetical protein